MTASVAVGHPSRSWTTMLGGRRLRELRREHGLSQEELAGQAGISVTTVVRLERRALAVCRGRTLARLARALDEQIAALRPPPATTGAQASIQP